MKSINKTAFACFFPVVPINMGSAEVCFSFFESWPLRKKRLFQLSPGKNLSNKKLVSIDTKKDKPFNKICSLPRMIFCIYKYLKNSKKPLLIIEGPSWVGYSFIIYKCLNFLLPNLKTIYHGHSIEFEIRKRNSNFLISGLTKFFEKNIFNSVNYATSVSRIEASKIKKLYGINPYVFPNAINPKRLNLNKNYRTNLKLPQKFILFCGSYKYKPNHDAINILVNKIMPNLIKTNPELKLVLTGGGVDFERKWLINLGIVKKSKMIYALNNCICTVIPILEGYGSRVKIIEALMMGVVVVTTNKGIEGIDYNKKKQPPFVTNNVNELGKMTEKVIKMKNVKTKSRLVRRNFQSQYSMELITRKFYRHINKKL